MGHGRFGPSFIWVHVVQVVLVGPCGPCGPSFIGLTYLVYCGPSFDCGSLGLILVPDPSANHCCYFRYRNIHSFVSSLWGVLHVTIPNPLT